MNHMFRADFVKVDKSILSYPILPFDNFKGFHINMLLFYPLQWSFAILFHKLCKIYKCSWSYNIYYYLSLHSNCQAQVQPWRCRRPTICSFLQTLNYIGLWEQNSSFIISRLKNDLFCYHYFIFFSLSK